jgi:phenylpropionate dioxygenase-like ring-hydroxylating dioxygenase large terminal subunit
MCCEHPFAPGCAACSADRGAHDFRNTNKGAQKQGSATARLIEVDTNCVLYRRRQNLPLRSIELTRARTKEHQEPEMITAAENELLTRVGRGTPMGQFIRQFWIPASLSSELVADGPQMRLMLLGEKLIAFRDTGGRVGIMDHRCPHRLSSLFLGLNEDHGIRCAYHGWKFDVDGNCLDQPNLPDKNKYPAGVKATAYKTIERGGLVFVYMGERAVAPPLPEIDAITCEQPDDRNIALTQRDCNWLQALEGDIDTSHLGFLHAGHIDASKMDPKDAATYTVLNKAPRINVSEMPFGTMYSAQRDAMEGHEHERPDGTESVGECLGADRRRAYHDLQHRPAACQRQFQVT